MSLSMAEHSSSATEIHLPDDIDWEMLDKSRFFFLSAALFSCVSGSLYPIVVLKTRQQVMLSAIPTFKMASSIFRSEGYRGFYFGFGTSLVGTIPARAVYTCALEVTKSNLGNAGNSHLGLSSASASAIAIAAAGLSATVAAQLVWTPVDVVSHWLIVHKSNYSGGIDAFKKIIYSDAVKGLYRGFGLSILTYAPSNALWWASYSAANRVIWRGCRPEGRKVVAAQGLSAAMASGVSALVTMPIDTIKTRLQVFYREGSGLVESLRSLMKEGGFGACYRGLGMRWASMSLSATTMVTTYEFLKRLSIKDHGSFA